MKRRLLTGAMLIGSFIAVNAQTTVFEENWDGVGPGIAGWTLYNVDGLTPADDPSGISQLVTDAWNIVNFPEDVDPAYVYPEDATGMAGNVAVSNSWYNPIGVANDWLVSPAITIPANATTASLTFAANSLGAAAYLEDYEVLISTTDNEIASFTLLLNVANELSSGSFRTISLNTYVGNTVYIAFRNKGNDQYTMQLDNIKVTTDGTAGVNDNLSSKLSVYPNPTSNVVNIDNNDNILISGISIVDINGRTVKSAKFDGVSSAQINISDLSSGMYMMNISSDKGMTTKKIVKN